VGVKVGDGEGVKVVVGDGVALGEAVVVRVALGEGESVCEGCAVTVGNDGRPPQAASHKNVKTTATVKLIFIQRIKAR